MGSNAFLLSIVTAAAFRVVLGADAGINYNTTALSAWNFDLYREPVERTPWALEVRPDIMAAVYNSRQYGYLQGDGSFAQPFAFPYNQTTDCTNLRTGENRLCGGDNPEGVGNLLLGGRFRLGRRLIFHPGVAVRIASSNSFIESQDEITASRINASAFTALYGGGWLEWELPIGERVRLLMRTEVEAWYLGATDPTSIFYIPYQVRFVQPDLIFTGQVMTWVDVTRRNGIAVDLNVQDGLFLDSHHQIYAGEREPDNYEAPKNENQVTITGRVVYRRSWLPNLMTDLSLGLLGLLPRASDIEDPQAGEFRLPIGDWEINFVGGASLMYFGRPRWLTLRLSYERNYDQLQFRNSGAVHDSIDLLAAFGPFFDGFSFSVTLTWSRFPVEVQRLNSSGCARNADGCQVVQEGPDIPSGSTDAEVAQICSDFYDHQCEHCDSITRAFDTIGLNLDIRYLHEFGDVLFGPFFTGYIYGQIGESIDNELINPTSDVCPNQVANPRVDYASCYMPPNHDPVEAILMLGLRLQWSGGNARNPRRQQDMAGATSGSRTERRLALQRMTREERLIPGFGYRSTQYGERGEGEGLFETDDPFGHIGADGLYEQVVEEPVDETVDEALDEEHQWFGEEVEQEPAPVEGEGTQETGAGEQGGADEAPDTDGTGGSLGPPPNEVIFDQDQSEETPP